MATSVDGARQNRTAVTQHEESDDIKRWSGVPVRGSNSEWLSTVKAVSVSCNLTDTTVQANQTGLIFRSLNLYEVKNFMLLRGGV